MDSPEWNLPLFFIEGGIIQARTDRLRSLGQTAKKEPEGSNLWGRLALAGSQRWDSPISSVVTWLILPVVICLSQRLSHACLSKSKFLQRNCEWLIKSVMIYMTNTLLLDNRGNSRANTCRKGLTSGGLHLLDQNHPG
jgi:hypothetical protein